MLTTKQIITKYGQPGDSNLISLTLPYPMRIAWDKAHTVSKIQCHKLIAPNLKAVFDDILAKYTLPKMQELGIDLFGGCYNFRKKRGGSDWSRHAWGIAIDLDPDRNGLKTKWPNAQFAKPEYKDMVDIFYKHGFVNQGKELGFDAMHFEIAN